ncbi:MAG: hypothetical protein J7M25_18210 [Deltaproteobacteria bacterium]|nr:hypothetical protein [Deltaproteobacteria bacterium]
MTQSAEETLTIRVSYHGHVLKKATSLEELKRTSCFVPYEAPMPVGTTLVARFCTVDGRGMGPNLVSRVAHVEEISTRDKSGHPGMVLNFEELNEQEQDFIVHIGDAMSLEEASAEFPDEPDPIPEPDIEVPDSPEVPDVVEKAASVQDAPSESAPGSPSDPEAPPQAQDQKQDKDIHGRDSVSAAGEIGNSSAGEIQVPPAAPETPSVELADLEATQETNQPEPSTEAHSSSASDPEPTEEEPEEKPKKKRRRRKKKNDDQNGGNASQPPDPSSDADQDAAPAQMELGTSDVTESSETTDTTNENDAHHDEPKKKKRGRRRRKKKTT